MYTYPHAILDDETSKLTDFHLELFAFNRRILKLGGHQIFLAIQMSIFFKDLIHQGAVLDLID